MVLQRKSLYELFRSYAHDQGFALIFPTGKEKETPKAVYLLNEENAIELRAIYNAFSLTLHSPTGPLMIMSPAVEKSLQSPKRRVSFSNPFQLSLSLKEKEPKSNERRPKETHGAKFYVMQVNGLGPTSIQRQYRVTIVSGEQKIVTSWGSPGKNGMSVDDSITMYLFETSPVTFTIERRHRMGRPTTVAESTSSGLSDLMSRQQGDRSKPLTVELEVESRPVTIQVRIQTYNIISEIKVKDQRPQAIFDNYPATVLGVVDTLGRLLPKLKQTQQISYLMLYFFLREMKGYMDEHRREISSFDVEDSIWRFLRESTRYMQNIAEPKSKALPEGDFSPASIIFRGFSTVFLLHRPQGSDLDGKERSILLNQLNVLLKALLNETPYSPKSSSLSPEYIVLQKLEGVKMTPPRPQEQDDEIFLTKEDTTFHDISRWMVNPDADQQVLWLSAKSDSGTKNQVITMFTNAARVIGLPTVYYSFTQANADKQDSHSNLTSMMDNIIYQFAHFDPTLANSFKSAIQAGDDFRSPDDLYSRFQLLLRSLLSLEFAGNAKLSPVLLLIDDLELPTNVSPSSECNHFLQLLHAATKAKLQASPPTSPIPNSCSASTFSGSSSPGSQVCNSLPLPSFLRIVIMSRSLGNQPALIAKFALIRDYRQFMASKKEKGKGNQRAQAPLTPIAEASSQSSTEN